MPKITNPALPLNGLFAVAKPSGMTSMAVLECMQSLFSDSPLFVEGQQLDKLRATGSKGKGRKKGKAPVKIGQGGTLDPLADGVLVVGIGKGTKSLGQFIRCTKEYRTVGLLGCETDSYDSEGARVRLAPWKHVSRDLIEQTLPQFRGNIKQLPPIYSALKMDGKPLYEYAREGKPLPRPIEARDAEVSELELTEWRDASEHTYHWPEKELSEDEKKRADGIKSLIVEAEGDRPPEETPESAKVLQAAEPPPTEPPNPDERPPVFGLKMTVSSGTYVRSIVHDIGLSMGSAAHVVSLTRTRQGDFGLGEGDDAGDCVPWDVILKAYEEHKGGGAGSPISAVSDESKRAEWEKLILSKWHE